MGISRAQFDASKSRWEDKPFTDIQAGTTQIKRVIIDGVEVWTAGYFSAATIDDDGSGPAGIVAANYTFNVIGSDGIGAGGQIIGSVSAARRLTGIVSIVYGGLGHEVGDILELEMVGAAWFTNPEIEVTEI